MMTTSPTSVISMRRLLEIKVRKSGLSQRGSRVWPSQTSLIAALDNWIRHDNAAYLHSSLGYKPPEIFEQNYFNTNSPKTLLKSRLLNGGQYRLSGLVDACIGEKKSNIISSVLTTFHGCVFNAKWKNIS